MEIIHNVTPESGLDGRYHFVYKIVNKVNGRYYIGKHSTSDYLDSYIGSGLLIGKAISKYGQDSFVKEIVCFLPSSHDAFQKEYELIANLMEDKLIYNLKAGGDGGFCHCDECNMKRIAGIAASDKVKENARTQAHNRIGKSHSEESKKKISISNTGKTRSEETRLRQSRNKAGVAQRIVTCPHCGKSGGITGMMQFHFDNCGKIKSRTVSVVKCPHCDKEGNANIMKRWHFENCKHKR